MFTTMVKNKTVYGIIWSVVLIVSVCIFFVASEKNFWREFFVTEFDLVVTAAVLSFLLTNRNEREVKR